MKAYLFVFEKNIPEGTRYYGQSANFQIRHTVETSAQTVAANAMTIDKLRVKMATAPGSGKSRIFTLYKNGSSTALTCTVSGTNTSATDTSNSVSFSAGDTYSFEQTITGSSLAASGALTISADMVATTAYSVGYRAGNFNNAATRYSAIMGDAALFGSSFDTYATVMPVAGTFKNLHVKYQTAPSSGKFRQFRLVKNGVDTSLVTTISGTSTTGSDTTNSASVVAGDKVGYKILPDSTPTDTVGAASMTFQPTTDGQFFLAATFSDISNYANLFDNAIGGQSTFSATESDMYLTVPLITALSLYLRAAVVPGASKSWTITQRKNAVNTAISAVVSGASSAEGNSTGSVTYNADDNYMLGIVSSGSPAGSEMFYSAGFIIVADQTGVLTGYDNSGNNAYGTITGRGDPGLITGYNNTAGGGSTNNIFIVE